jgi:hypothetical protein
MYNEYVYDNGNQSGAAIDALLELPPPLPDADEPASDSGALMPYAVASPCIFSRICSMIGFKFSSTANSSRDLLIACLMRASHTDEPASDSGAVMPYAVASCYKFLL